MIILLGIMPKLLAHEYFANFRQYKKALAVKLAEGELFLFTGLSRFMDIAGGIESDLPSGLDIHPVH